MLCIQYPTVFLVSSLGFLVATQTASTKHSHSLPIHNISFFSVSILINYILKHTIAQAWRLEVIIIFVPLLTFIYNQSLIMIKCIS